MRRRKKKKGRLWLLLLQFLSYKTSENSETCLSHYPRGARRNDFSCFPNNFLKMYLKIKKKKSKGANPQITSTDIFQKYCPCMLEVPGV